MKYFRQITSGLISLFSGMIVTFRYMRKKPVTVLYPKESIATPQFKGPISFTVDDIDGSHKCIACNACIKACPSRCMHLEISKNDDGKRVLTDFKVDHMLCSLCTICVDVCPTDALENDSKNYAEVATTRSPMIHDLLQPFRDKGIDVNQPILTPAQKKAMQESASKQSDSPNPSGTDASEENSKP